MCVVGGAGHVGLPLAISLAEAGQRVVIQDINHESVTTIANGKMPFLEAGAAPALRRVVGRTLTATTDAAVIGRSRLVIVVIGTPVDEHLNPEFGTFRRLFGEIAGVIRDGQHIILRSTVFPGTTAWTRDFLKAKGKRVRVSFCPERIAQGHAMEELRALPQIVGAFDAAARNEAAELFSKLCDDIIFLDPLEAELAKLFSNVWRYIQFATANQFFEIASQHGVDYYRIHHAITHRYPRLQNLPGAGFAAGPCLFKDTMQLAAFSNNSFFLGHAAMLVNEGLPNHVVQLLKARYPLREKAVGILGMAFKANIDDRRESLAYKLRKILEIEAGSVLCSDVFIDEPDFVSPAELIRRSDIVVIGAPHREYARLAIPRSKVLVDIWNMFGRGGAI